MDQTILFSSGHKSSENQFDTLGHTTHPVTKQVFLKMFYLHILVWLNNMCGEDRVKIFTSLEMVAERINIVFLHSLTPINYSNSRTIFTITSAQESLDVDGYIVRSKRFTSWGYVGTKSVNPR